MDVELSTKEELAIKLNLLKRSDKELSEEDRNGRYLKAYTRLKQEVSRISLKMMDEELFFLLVPKSFKDKGRKLMTETINSFKNEIYVALFKDYNADEYSNILKQMNSIVTESYFNSKDFGDGTELYNLNPFCHLMYVNGSVIKDS